MWFTRLFPALLTLALSAAATGQQAGPTPVRIAEQQDIRDQLTEREDENRVEDPWSTTLFGHLFTVSGEYEITVGAIEPIAHGDDPPEGEDRVLLSQELEVELFYTLGAPLSFFVQLQLGMEEDLLSETRRGVSDLFVDRGEAWVYAEDVFGSGLDVEVGTLEFEDDRLWWFDEDLDAVRLTYERELWELVLALAYPVGPKRLDEDRVDSEEEGRLRLFGEASWDFADPHTVELFVVHEDDRSGGRSVGANVREKRLDESDASLTWLGPRFIGGFEGSRLGRLGYWIDVGWVRGSERVIAYGDPVGGRVVIESVERRDVSGWAFDLGFTWFSPWRHEPRVTLSYAVGSGDRNPDGGSDRSFRQTGLHGNETGFGGVQRFPYYGILLDPELSNLRVLTLGSGLSLLRSSSAELVYHYYRLVHPAEELFDARLEAPLNGRDRDLGHALDLVVAIEEGDHLELEFHASVFHAGDAFGHPRRDWAFGGYAALRYAF